MQLIEMERLPKKAGRAVLKFSPWARWIHREGDTIAIPLKPSVEFYPLLEGEQFLVRWHRHRCQNCGTATQPFELYFGGTDQRTSFLVDLYRTAFRYFQRGSEPAFYRALKPLVIRVLEARWGRDRTRRQGDIFAYPLPWGWDKLTKRAIEQRDDWFYIDHERTDMLFSTRHRLTGYLGRVGGPTVGLTERGTSILTVGEGRVIAPDHEPLKLDGPHIIAQTAQLRYPHSAD